RVADAIGDDDGAVEDVAGDRVAADLAGGGSVVVKIDGGRACIDGPASVDINEAVLDRDACAPNLDQLVVGFNAGLDGQARDGRAVAAEIDPVICAEAGLMTGNDRRPNGRGRAGSRNEGAVRIDALKRQVRLVDIEADGVTDAVASGLGISAW